MVDTCSYDAAEDNEISMREGEEVIEIEETDEAWWTGTAANGQRGLFPCTSRCMRLPLSPALICVLLLANYVELQG